jgi:hypothetical protein
VPPSSSATLKLDVRKGEQVMIRHADKLPDIKVAESEATKQCLRRRESMEEGFDYNWEYDRKDELWKKIKRRKSIGTPCESFLFLLPTDGTFKWLPFLDVKVDRDQVKESELIPGLFDVIISKRKTEDESKRNYRNVPLSSLSHHCSDPSTFKWNIDDATHII